MSVGASVLTGMSVGVSKYQQGCQNVSGGVKMSTGMSKCQWECQHVNRDIKMLVGSASIVAVAGSKHQ